MSRLEKPLHEQMQTFCRYHLGKSCFAPFTGGDWPAWMAFCYLLRPYSNGGGANAIDALRATLACAQHTKPVLVVFLQTIPGALDWGYIQKLWPVIADRVIVRDVADKDPFKLHAIERCEFYRGDSKVLEESITHHGAHGRYPVMRLAGGRS